MLTLRNINTEYISIEHWEIQPGECWAVLGRNGSGKRKLAQLITDEEPLLTNKAEGERRCSYKTIAMLSFEQQQAFYETELKNDDTDFMDHLDAGTTVRQILGGENVQLKELAFLGLEALMEKGYRLLSSGESRKVLLAQALIQMPDLLILDEPYDSLDADSKRELATFLESLSVQGVTQPLFLLNSIDEVSPWHTHVAIMEKGEIIAQGLREDILSNSDLLALLSFDAAKLPRWPDTLEQALNTDCIVKLNNGRVKYSDTLIFENVNLSVKPGEHTLITGANGSGKSSLLGLITGDHPQCYGNDLTVLGFKRGSGESIWQVKKQIGIVSPELHRNHRVSGSALHIVLSGFFDSIGLYEAVTSQQVRHARQWLDLVGLQAKSSTAFRQLSYGEQRLVLIARALVKQPALLVLDEPTQGLDDINRHRLMYFLEHLAGQQWTTLIMASHRPDENLDLFKTFVAL